MKATLENQKICPKIQFTGKFKILNINFYAKKLYFLRIFKGKNYLNNLNFCAKNHDFDQKQNYQKLNIIEF